MALAMVADRLQRVMEEADLMKRLQGVIELVEEKMDEGGGHHA